MTPSPRTQRKAEAMWADASREIAFGRGEVGLRILASQIRLAAVIAPEVNVRAGGVARPGLDTPPGYARSGLFRYMALTPTIRVYEFRDHIFEIRSAAELDAILLHELGHYLCGHGETDRPASRATEYDADAMGAALAEHHAEDLNAPLARVLEWLDKGAEHNDQGEA